MADFYTCLMMPFNSRCERQKEDHQGHEGVNVSVNVLVSSFLPLYTFRSSLSVGPVSLCCGTLRTKRQLLQDHVKSMAEDEYGHL
eukprot:scaffold205520_cov19-Prasinocladus_malaysianus.AAC.1